jgi:flagellar hook-associated protein 2
MSTGAGIVGTALGLSNAPSGTVTIDGQSVAINLATDSLSTIAQRINAAGSGVTASVTTDTSSGSTQYRLELSGDGASNLTDDNHVLESLGLVSQGVADQRTAAQDAHIVIDGSDVYRSTNDISDAVDGVTFHLLQADENTTTQVSVAADTDSTVSAVQSFVSSFNTVMDAINSGESYDTSTDTGGTFFGDPTIMMLQSRLHDAVMNPVSGATGDYTLMSQIGISTNTSGELTLDTTKLQSALEANPDAVARLFATHGQATNSEVSFVNASSGTVASSATGYAVNVTQAATQATATSAHLAGGITQNETLTINGNCIVSLTAGETLQQACDAINTILLGNSQDVTATVQGDQLQLTGKLYGSSKTFSVKSNLASGVGGTDLGASAANQSRIYAGLDVQGTINGEACTGYGQYLTGNTGDANVAGLQLMIASATTGSKGYVQVGKGAGSRVDDFAAQATDTNGTMTADENAIQAEIDADNAEITQMNDDVAQYISDMRDKFTQMEETMGQEQNISSYLSGQIAALTNTSASSSSSNNSSSSSSS